MLKGFKNNNIISMRNRDISIGEKVDTRVCQYTSPLDTIDTTLFRKEVPAKLKYVKRKVINDKDISPRLFSKLKLKCLSLGFELRQKDIIETLYPLNISNTTMARVINDLIPEAKATQGSVASMIRFLKTSETSKKMADELDKLLDDEL